MCTCHRSQRTKKKQPGGSKGRKAGIPAHPDASSWKGWEGKQESVTLGGPCVLSGDLSLDCGVKDAHPRQAPESEGAVADLERLR